MHAEWSNWQLKSPTPYMNKRAYAAVTGAYWGFTLTDGALRMLVLLKFHERGMSPIELAFLFLLYEFCGILTNAFGGWWASRSGLKVTLVAGLALQVVSLLLLSLVEFDWGWLPWVSIAYVMFTQALSGVAKDLTKMSSKSAVKVLAPSGDAVSSERGLMRWVSLLTGSKNALKGVGFFLGGVLLTNVGFQGALSLMAAALTVVLLLVVFSVKEGLSGKTKTLSFKAMFSKSPQINRLSFARVFLFAARDVWFVVGLPVFLSEALGWTFQQVGGFMAVWVIGYGIVQAMTPALVRQSEVSEASRKALWWGLFLTVIAVGIAAAVSMQFYVTTAVLVGLLIYGVVFAVNSALHSYLILAFSPDDEVASSVGFYYMANACGRLLGTLLSGLSYYYGGLTLCLWVSAVLLIIATVSVRRLKA